MYIARPPISLKKITLESFHGKVFFHTCYNAYFGENLKLFDVTDFIALLTQHLPPRGTHYIRRYGLYSSRTRGKWIDKPYVVRLAPDGWKEKLTCFSEAENIQAEDEADRLSFFRRKQSLLPKVPARVGEADCKDL